MTSPVDINLREVLDRVDEQAFTQLFTEDLAWNRPEHPPITMTLDDRDITVRQVANYRGLGVWHCPSIPTREGQRLVDKEVARRSTERLIIFTEPDRQEWRWPRYANHRGIGNPRLVNHPHITGQPNPNLVERLTRITIDPSAGTTLPELLQRMREAFDAEAEKASVAAARLMGALYEQLAAAGIADADASVILARILFLMFGDDTGMWRATTSDPPIPNLFHDYLTDHTDPNGADLAQRLHDIFTVVDTPANRRPAGTHPHLNRLPYINGGIFHDPVTIPATLPKTLRTALIAACKFDWGQISPAVFGSMFQEVKSPEERRALGEHYTTEQNILKTIDPLFMDELRDKLAAAWDNKAQLTRLHNSLREMRYFDPACGCGNFLVVAYRELRALELELLKRRIELNERDGRHSGTVPQQLAMDASEWLNVTIDQFYGIEIEPWPARIAQTAMFLVDHQANQRMEQDLGQAPDRLPITITAHIAIGNALQLDWSTLLPPTPKVNVFGNPPFLGISSRTPDQTGDLSAAWGPNYHGTLDYVTGWHAKTLQYFSHQDGRWAFVTTNSITQGEAVEPLFAPIEAGDWSIKFAHRTFKWTSEAAGQAAVHCVVIGFSRHVTHPRLFDYSTPASDPEEILGLAHITPYLTDGPSVIVRPASRPLNPQLGEVKYGNKPTDGSNLILDEDGYEEAMSDAIASQYVRAYIGAHELIHGGQRHCLWLPESTPRERQQSRVLRTHIQAVRQFREKSKAASTRAAAATPHLFRQIAQPSTAYLCIPRHASETREYFLAARFGPATIASDATFLAEDADGFMFAVISSSMFITWQRTVGGRLKSDLRFNKLLTWNTFPLPHVSSDRRQDIITAAEVLAAARSSHGQRPLAELYAPGQIPVDVQEAHNSLDAAIDYLFGLPGEPTQIDRLSALFLAYSQMM